jgi:HAD superfamily hydrolase (TIGR01450 family)
MLSHTVSGMMLKNLKVNSKLVSKFGIRGGSKSTGMYMSTVTDTPIKMKSKECADLLKKTDVFIFDCDGVIWKGDSVIDGVPAVLDKLRELGKMVFFVTNNSTKSRKGYLKKFTGLGLNVKPEEIFSSSFAAAAYLEQNPLPPGKKVYIIGQEGIGEELDLLKIPHFGALEDKDKVIKLGPGVKVDHDHDVGAVIVGLPIALPAVIITAAGYAVAVGAVVATVSQTEIGRAHV